MASTAVQVVPVELIERKIYLIRGCKVMLDSDLAELYEVPTKALNQAVRRNVDRFPADFMFQLNAEELKNLRSQIVTSSLNYGGRRYLPYAFTEHGVVASKRAIQLNILIVRAFVRLREYLATHKDLAKKLEDVERTQQDHGSHIQQINGYIERLLEPPPEPAKRRIGFWSEVNFLQ